MSPKVDIASLTVSKLKSDIPFEKYNIDVSIDEVENSETGIKLKYKFVLLSTPTNAKISIEGFTSIQGGEAEVSKYLAPDERNVPLAVNLIYQELFPLFYIATKSLDIPCPAYKISEISTSVSPQAKASTHIPQEQQEIPHPQEPQEAPREETIEPVEAKQSEQPEVLEELEHLVEGPNVSPN